MGSKWKFFYIIKMTIFEGKHIPLESFKKFQATFMLKTLLHIAGTGFEKNYPLKIAPFYIAFAQSYGKITT
mgnify:FL=1